MKALRNPLITMDEKIDDFQLLYERNEETKRDYFVECTIPIKGKAKGYKAGRIDTAKFVDSETAELLFHVHEDTNSRKKLVSFNEHIGKLNIDEKDGVIELFLVIHPKEKAAPDKKPKGTVSTASAKLKI